MPTSSGTCLAETAGVARVSPVPVAFVLSSFDPGGTERQMIELLRRLDQRRWNIHLVCFRPKGAWFERAAAAAASVTSFPVTSFRAVNALHHLAQFRLWCRKRSIAVVHTGQLYSNIFGLTGAALAGVPVRIGNRRNINPNNGPLKLGAQRIAYTFAHKIVANSQAAAARLRKEGVSSHKIAVIPNGLDIERFPAPIRRTPARRVVVVANLRPEKGHDVLVQAAPHVLRRFPDAAFDIVGAGPLLDRLRQMTRQCEVGHAFTFFGHCDDVPARLAEGDIFVLPSRSEAMPNALLEAMAAGLPVVASSVGGIGEIVADGRTGLLVPADNPTALADRICGLMATPSLTAALGDAARTEIQGRYSFSRMVTAFEAIYDTELRRRCPTLMAAREPVAV
jgi:glycosyltransferase involved in cell wall biosynthesis